MSYHFIGLGGIGMSALARILLQRGAQVRGSDRNASALLDRLRQEGAKIQIGHDSNALSKEDLVVYSSGIDEENVEIKRAKELGLPLLHRSEMLDRLIGTQRPLLVTGTHGKTTTSALLSSVLLEASLDPSFVVGGILLKLQTNGRSGTGPYFVAEADESDGSFLKTAAFGAIVTNLEREHLSYWKSEEKLFDAFACFFQNVRNPQHLFWCGDDLHLRSLNPPGFSYGFSPTNNFCITNFSQEDDGIVFDLNEHRSIKVALFGRHNALNSAAVFALALSLGVEESAIRRAFLSFEGTQRRLERIAEVQKIEIYDDYGHHPTEISATLRALRAKARERRIVVLFQPHRYSRFLDLFQEFLLSFEEADLLIVTDIYAAGEEPLPISAEDFVAKQPSARYIPRAELTKKSAELLCVGDLVITFGAGDISKTARELPEYLKDKKLTVGVVYGGASSEYEVSLSSAQTILEALDPSLYHCKPFLIPKQGTWEENRKILDGLADCDVCFPIVHGQRSEDGMMAALLEWVGIPYVGCGRHSGALCMQKTWMKQIALHHGVPTAPFVEFSAARWRRDRSSLKKLVLEKLTYPVWVKPVHLGSSIGVRRVTSEGDLEEAAAFAFGYDDVIVIENEIVGREIEFGLIGNDFPRCGAPGEILSGGKFHSYESKYGPTACDARIPAALTPEQEQRGKELAFTMYEACGCQGLSRIDFFFDASGQFWFNEINTMPGCTPTSPYPAMWEAVGVSKRELVNELIFLALHRWRVMR